MVENQFEISSIIIVIIIVIMTASEVLEENENVLILCTLEIEQIK